MKKTILLFCALLACLPLLLSCAATHEYRDDLEVRELYSLSERSDGAYLVDNSGFLEDYFALPDYVTEHAILYRRETDSLDEIGFFHVTEGNAEKLKRMIEEEYLSAAYEKNRDFYDSYMPRETPKLANAEVRIFGNYVVYAVLSDTDKAELFRSMKYALRTTKNTASNR
ncbi:MAG: DUF4358 domain-containing protein [Ruminococcaceae bacterium]|nr:DUF4358 domain-containing protein [Oscillospiraceae bacterium]